MKFPSLIIVKDSMLQRYNIFLAQRAKLGKMKKEKILYPRLLRVSTTRHAWEREDRKTPAGIKKNMFILSFCLKNTKPGVD